MKHTSLIIALFIAFILSGTLSACGNTFHGVGKDMERMGRNIQETLE